MTRNENKEGRSIKTSALAGCATTVDFAGSASGEMPVDHGTGGGDQ